MLLKAGNFVPAPEGQWQAVLVDVVDMGEAENNYGQMKHNVKYVFQIDALMENGKPFIVSGRYNATLHEKGNLRKFLQAFRGKAFTPDELKGFDDEDLIGTNAQVNIIHNQGNNGAVYANIASIAPWNPRLGDEIQAVDYTRVKDREEKGNFTTETGAKF